VAKVGWGGGETGAAGGTIQSNTLFQTRQVNGEKERGNKNVVRKSSQITDVLEKIT